MRTTWLLRLSLLLVLLAQGLAGAAATRRRQQRSVGDVSPDGNLWFTNLGNHTVGRITPAGVVSSFRGTGISYVRRAQRHRQRGRHHGHRRLVRLIGVHPSRLLVFTPTAPS